MKGQVKGVSLVACAFEFSFMGGSMGAVVGERFVRAVDTSLENKIPLVCFSASGGARMQEALYSLMQMAKTSAALARLSKKGLPFISVMTDPTMGGVSASLAMLGDVNIGEPNALIGFAGPRVIEQTVRETLPEGFQRSEFLLQHGAIDMLVDRRDMRDRIASILAILSHQPAPCCGIRRCGTAGDHDMSDDGSAAARHTTLDAWLHWQEGLHPNKIDLGLDRVRAVWRRLHAEAPPFVVITVGGTNGKGSSVAMLENILAAAVYRTGAYTSPHLLRYNERVRVAGETASDEQLCVAFARVDVARGDISLTYFEFGTLAALDIFFGAELDVAILEVGMGGRLDAVNILDADVALVTTVDIDHAAWLGTDREAIGVEKAGIFRARRPAVYGDEAPPQSVVTYAHDVDAELYVYGRDYHAEADAAGWTWSGGTRRRHALPAPHLRGSYQYINAAAVLMVLECLSARLPVSQYAVRHGLATVELPGRFHILDGLGLRICDVAHNPQAARALASALRDLRCGGRTHAVCAMLADKDQRAVVEALADVVDVWHVAGLSCERGSDAVMLSAVVRGVAGERPVHTYDDVESALGAAQSMAAEEDRIVAVGSLYTVAAALPPPQGCATRVLPREQWSRQAKSDLATGTAMLDRPAQPPASPAPVSPSTPVATGAAPAPPVKTAPAAAPTAPATSAPLAAGAVG